MASQASDMREFSGPVGGDEGAPEEPKPARGSALASFIASGAPVKGSPDAEVVVIDFSDFQCTNCRRFATLTEPQIDKDYVDPGKVAIVFKHFPIFGPDSKTAAMASMCAHEQGRFWDFHDALYEGQGAEGSGWANAAAMSEFASALGLDMEQFGQCLDDQKYSAYVDADFELASSLQFRGTPSFIIMKSDGSDAEGLLGAQPYASFKTVIDGKL